jgi:Protein of unknown function (DUF4038)/Putative collagen-binding domain of a collagenase
MASDSFTYSNGTLATASGGVWFNNSGSLNVVSNQVKISTVGADVFVLYDTPTGSNDNWSQATVGAMTGGSGGGNYENMGVCARFSRTALTGYFACRSTDAQLELFSVNAGSFSGTLGTWPLAVAAATGVLKLECIGTAIKVYWDGAEVISITNSDVTTGQYTGLSSFSNGGFATPVFEDDWSNSSAPPGATGTIAVTEDADTAAITGSSAPPGSFGIIATTDADDTAALVGTFSPLINLTGTIAVTDADDTATIVGTSSSPAGTGRYPVSVSGRKFLDQFGAIFPFVENTVWGLTQNGSNAEITQIIDATADAGFNAIKFWPCGGNYNTYGGSGWTRYQNKAGANFFTGTALASSLGPAWSSVDWAIAECRRRNIVPVVSLPYTGFNNDQGIGNDLMTAGTTNAYNYGAAVAARYPIGTYPEIVWHIGADTTFNYGSGPSLVIDALHHGVKDTEGATHRLMLAEPVQGVTGYSMFISQEGTSGSGYQWVRLDANAEYEYRFDVVDAFDAIYNQAGATTEAVYDAEPPYRGSPWIGPPTDQQLRARTYSDLIRGAAGVAYGDEAIWGVSKANGNGGTASTWAPALASSQFLDQGRACQFLRGYVADATWAPSNFITTGLGTGSTKAAGGAAANVALAYFPTSRAVTVDTSILAGTAAVRLRWYDPTLGTYTTVADSESQTPSRAVTYPAGSHTDGSTDYVLVVDLATASGTVTVTDADDTASIVGTFIAASGASGTITVTDADDVAAIDGVVTVSSNVTGIIAATDDADTAVIVGTFTSVPVIGVIAIVEANDTARITDHVPSVDTTSGYVLGEWQMRRGDRLPMLSVIIQDDAGLAVDLTDGTAYLMLRAEDGSEELELPAGHPPVTYNNGWLVLQAYIQDPLNGVVVYDWPDAQTAGLTVGVDELMVSVHFPNGSSISAPSDREARLIVRPALLPPF